MMSKVKSAVNGNLLSALAMLIGIIATLYFSGVASAWTIYPSIIIGTLIGGVMARRVKMIQMPQMVALFNGLGGGASALVGILSAEMLGFSTDQISQIQDSGNMPFVMFTSMLAIAVGMITLIGSLIAAGKLHRVISQRPVTWPMHSAMTLLTLIITVITIIIGSFAAKEYMLVLIIACVLFSSLFGLYFSIRVGGADMPITISLLNSLSGVAGSIAGMAISDLFLVAVGGIVGASGLLLTQIMCRAMNRSLLSILLGGKTGHKRKPVTSNTSAKESSNVETKKSDSKKTPGQVLADAKDVIIVPGYGMALAQAQHLVKQLADTLENRGARVRFAIHPVAGRMPGHMNVLLAEADVPYEKLFEMDAINDDFAKTDAVVVIGANDVLNPAARNAEGTPIYGMPVLNVDKAPEVIICNFDLKPGYAGVENPLYTRKEGVYLELGDAKQTLQKLLHDVNSAKADKEEPAVKGPAAVLADAKDVIIVPGYGMALAQAQHLVKQLADTLENRGARVRFAIHPVAGRMPGHMNVLLAEADVPYEKLFEMDAINDDFAKTDAVVVIGANDVLNPAARNAEGTPIYGMPVLNVDKAPEVIICNFDLKPGYAGVENPLYTRKEGVYLELGDAKQTLQKLLQGVNSAKVDKEEPIVKGPAAVLADAKDVIIVPGYGMALAQAQHLVKQLADTLENRGARVRFAIHPVAGRMPGHMNVLLAEADVPYEKLFEMDAINDDFAKTDAVVVIGANDVLNPAARNAEGTPIYGMPVLNVDKAPEVIICNFDLKPGYAGVENPLYTRKEGVYLELGDAKQTLQKLLQGVNSAKADKEEPVVKGPAAVLADAKDVIIVPGYGMALAQAQHLVKQLADTLENRGARVRFAIHPVAGRMPGHMNVLLAEADVPYEKLFEMDAINDDFSKTDAVVVIGANDVLNPAARNAEGTPIYGMPVLNVDKAPEVIICNYDLKPGYAGVENPLYTKEQGVYLELGDAKETLSKLISLI
jgi:NAD(P) transhydrogenase subunit beta